MAGFGPEGIAMTDLFFRCGWRIIHLPRDDQYPFLGPTVVVRRGQWELRMYPEVFDNMTDEDFADYIGRCYRDAAADHLAADLDVLARQLAGSMEQGNGLPIVTGVRYDEVKDALERWRKTKRDMEEVAT